MVSTRTRPGGSSRLAKPNTVSRKKIVTDVVRGSDERPETAVVPAGSQSDEEEPEPEAGTQREERGGKVTQARARSAVERDEHDGKRSGGDAGHDLQGEDITLDESCNHRNSSGEERGDRSDDAHGADGQCSVEQPYACRTRRTCESARRQIARTDRPTHERCQSQHQHEADAMRPQHHGRRCYPTCGQPAEEVTGAERERGGEGEEGSHGTTQCSSRSRRAARWWSRGEFEVTERRAR